MVTAQDTQQNASQMLNDQGLESVVWDHCIVGNGVSALWLAHYYWSQKRTVLWITSDEPYNSERAFLQHGWLWQVSRENAAWLKENLSGFSTDQDPLFTLKSFDARASQRKFRNWGEHTPDMGSHEENHFNRVAEEVSVDAENSFLDFWSWHQKLHQFHDLKVSQTPATIELFSEPRFVRLQGWPVVELKTENSKITSVVLAGVLSGTKKKQKVEVKANHFTLGDFDEVLSSLIVNTDDAQVLSDALKGRAYRAGFGLHLWHKNSEVIQNQPLNELLFIPLVLNPSEKNEPSHVVGRFFKNGENSEIQSIWIGFLTDAELEDNNEILKKIKHSKRAIDRTISGFANSILKEAVTFEPRMSARHLKKKTRTEALGASLISDTFGPAEVLANLILMSKLISQKNEVQTNKHEPSTHNAIEAAL